LIELLLQPLDNGEVSDIRPDIFRYHDYRSFLKDWFSYLKGARPGFSRHSLAVQAQVATSYLPLILSGRRDLTLTFLAKLAPFLHLTKPELQHLENLVRLSTFDSFEGRLNALDQMKKSSQYQKKNPKEAEFYEYTRNWHYVVIREMAALEGFRTDPSWIRKRLNYRMPLADIKSALKFLIDNRYIEVNEQGGAVASKENVKVQGTVFTAALSQFHKEMLQLASRSIEASPYSERGIFGFTLAIHSSQYARAEGILKKAMQEFEDLEKEAQKLPRDSVYHVELAAFPLARAKPDRSDS
jgi:uncharacterized protein (TIGR02147 family)